MAAINAVQAVDNHAHVVAPDIEHDTDFDALRCDTLPSTATWSLANTRFGPDLQAAWKALYSLDADSTSPDNLARWQAAQRGMRDRRGAGYFDWVAQQAGIDVTFANRVTMARELGPKHFRWVPYDDALLFPLNNATQKAENPDRKGLFEAEEHHLGNYLTARSLRTLPPTLDDYMHLVVMPTLDAQRQAGAVAIKFEVAYLRSLDFEPASHDAAAAVYAKHVAGTAPEPRDYTTLQDYLFRAIAAEAGRLGLVVHIHTGSGCGGFFDDRGADPMLLDSVLNDPALRKDRLRPPARRGAVRPAQHAAHREAERLGGHVGARPDLFGRRGGADRPAVAGHAAGTRPLRERCRAVRRRHGLGGSHVDRQPQEPARARHRAHPAGPRWRDDH
jgi:hypothetical protein